MNRRKKANQILKKRDKKTKAKLNPKPKRNYVPKAEREKLEALALADSNSEVSGS